MTTLLIDTALFKSLAPGGPKEQVVDRLAMAVPIAQQVARLVPARSSQEKAACRGDSFSACLGGPELWFTSRGEQALEIPCNRGGAVIEGGARR